MEQAVANVAALVALWLAIEGAVWFRERLQRGEDTSVTLSCPQREERTPIASEHTEPVWSEPSTNCHGYRCEVCGNVHTWVWGPPAPVYVGDKFRFTFTGDGVARSE